MYIYADLNDYVYTSIADANIAGRLEYELQREEADAFILFDGRHFTPDLPAVYGRIDNPLDFSALQEQADKIIREASDVIYIYVTGLTAATVACINAARRYRKTIWLCHFDRLTQGYKRQEVL